MSDNTRHEIIMPALGMTQDTGEIVSWQKAAGDAVLADDILFEVETDKTTMEVEAGFAGVVVEIRAAAGDAVPVGSVIAVIDTDANAVAELVSSVVAQPVKAPSCEGEGEGVSPGHSATGARNVATASKNESKLDQPSSSIENQSKSVGTKPGRRQLSNPSTSHAANAVSGDVFATGPRTLASPKAKLAAWEKGIPLEQVVRAGAAQPLQFSDVDQFTPLARPIAVAQSLLQARVQHAAYKEFLIWASQQSENSEVSGQVWSIFASSAWRTQCAVDLSDDVAVQVEKWSDRDLDLITINADRMGLLDVVAADTTNDVKLVVRDMTDTVFVNYQSADEGTCPALTVVDDAGDYLLLSLRFDESGLSLDAAMSLLNRISQLVEQPLRHLL